MSTWARRFIASAMTRGSIALRRASTGWRISIGLLLTRTRPLPFLTEARAMAVLRLPLVVTTFSFLAFPFLVALVALALVALVALVALALVALALVALVALSSAFFSAFFSVFLAAIRIHLHSNGGWVHPTIC